MLGADWDRTYAASNTIYVARQNNVLSRDRINAPFSYSRAIISGMTGTKFGCGLAQCLSCAVIVDNPTAAATQSTCVVP